MRSGNAVRFRASFTDWDGVAADPTALNFALYDRDRELVLGPVVLTQVANRVAVGTWQYTTTTPRDLSGTYIYEFEGSMGGVAIREARKIVFEREAPV